MNNGSRRCPHLVLAPARACLAWEMQPGRCDHGPSQGLTLDHGTLGPDRVRGRRGNKAGVSARKGHGRTGQRGRPLGTGWRHLDPAVPSPGVLPHSTRRAGQAALQPQCPTNLLERVSRFRAATRTRKLLPGLADSASSPAASPGALGGGAGGRLRSSILSARPPPLPAPSSLQRVPGFTCTAGPGPVGSGGPGKCAHA